MVSFNELTFTRYGRMIVNRNDVWIGRSLLTYGEFSEWEAIAFRQFLCPGDFVVEAGANIGALTLPIAQHIGKDGMVFAFEPQPLNYYALCGNLALNSITNVQPVPAGCGAERDKMGVPYFDPCFPCNTGGMSLGTGQCNHTVDIVPIDDLNLPRLDFLKADVEGMETEVLRGAERTISRFRPLLYVENDRKDREGDLLAHLRGAEYRVYAHTTPLYNPANWRGVHENVFEGVGSFNLFCVPRERDDVDIEGLEEI